MAAEATGAEANGNNPTAGAEQETKTFTQEQVDSIVEGRLAREFKKYADYEELKTKAAEFDKQKEAEKSELQKATEKSEKLEAELNQLKRADELRGIRSKVSEETGVPATLLTGEDEDACKQQAEEILKFAKPEYPSIKKTETKVKPKAGGSPEYMREFAKEFFGR